MSHHSDDAMLVASTDSFWEPGNYKRTTKRIEDGHRLCDDLMKLINERAEIEKAYGKSLRTWSKKWNEIIERGPEYGTTEAAWKGALVEAERLCDLHLRVRDNLINDVQTKVKMWQKDNYHKTMMQIREKKDMEDSFKKAQKPWAKVLAKVNKAKADHHNACKNERSAMNQERNAGADSSLSPDQVKKLQDRVQKGKEEVQKTKEKYELAVREINDYNAKYIEDMTVVFNKCQDAERERLAFFKETLFGLHKCLNISVDPALPQIYEEFHHTINNADHEKDLKWWSNNHGINMAMNWPQFEEYSEEFRDISGRGKKGHIPEGNITLINQRSVCEDLPEYNADSKSSKKRNVTGKQNKGGQEKSTDKVQSNNPVNSNGKSENYDDMEEWEEEEDDYQNDALVDNGEPGVPVRALYDYDGAESDELSFKIGEVFEKLEDEDEQGWCKGRKDGHVGLYPANYVELVD